MIRAWTAACVGAVLYVVAAWSLHAGSGLLRTVVSNTTGQIEEQRVDGIDLRGVDRKEVSAGELTVKWRGAWELPASGLYDLSLDSRGPASWTIDGHSALEAGSSPGRSVTRTVWLDSGFHDLEMTYTTGPGEPYIDAGAAKPGAPPAPLDGLRTRPPSDRNVRAWEEALRMVLGVIAIALVVWGVRLTTTRAGDRWRARWDAIVRPQRQSTIARAAAWMVLALILGYAALLRIDAVTGRFGVVSSPGWMAAIQTRTFAAPKAIRPSSIDWHPEPLHEHRDGPPTHYFSDPYIYLDAARHMTSFYTAHFREPLFPFATRMSLAIFDGQDVAVSFASTFFSVLAVWFTYLLGAALCSRLAGLLGAAMLGIDRDVVSLASLGWRDDAYMAMVVVCLYFMVRVGREARRQPRVAGVGRWRVDRVRLEAAALGAIAGMTVLTRVMAVTLVGAGFSYLLFAMPGAWRRRVGTLAIAASAALVVASPYFINCWRTFGDPLYTFNVHGSIYSSAEGSSFNGTTAEYVGQKIASRPLESIDTVAQGLTTYPFSNKWYGLDEWRSGLREWASMAALVGFVVLAASASGRLVLVAMTGALIPFSLTWKVDPNFRFTEFVYPLLLIAAAVTVDAALRLTRAVLLPRPRRAPVRVQWRAWAVTSAAGALALWFVLSVAPAWMFRQSLRDGQQATVTAGQRDAAFFGPGWSDVIRATDIVSVRATLSGGSLWLPLPAAQDYTLSIRLDPFPRPLGPTPDRLPIIDVSVNGAPVTSLDVHWTFDHVGAYEVVLPRRLVHAGNNRLEFNVRRPPGLDAGAIQPGLTVGDAISLWYVRVFPGTH